MTKSALVERIAEKVKELNLTKRQTEVVVDTVFESIKDALARGGKVELRGFGSFRLRHRRHRNARNPKTGDVVEVPPKRVPYFKAGKDLRETVNRS